MAILTIPENDLRAAVTHGEPFELYHILGASDADIVADVLIADGVLTLAAELSFATKLVFVVTDANSSITALDVAIVGLDTNGDVQSESLSLDNGGAGGTVTVLSANVYSKITSITLSDASGNAAGDNVKVGSAFSAATDYEICTLRNAAAGDWISRGRLVWLDIDGRADQVSDSGGVVVEESLDGSTVHYTHVIDDIAGAIAIAASINVMFKVRLSMPFFRFRWQNGATAQTEFNVHVDAWTSLLSDEDEGGRTHYDLNPAVAADVNAAVAASDGLILMGFDSADDAAGVPHAHIVHGATGAGGDAIFGIRLIANTHEALMLGTKGIPVPNGISIAWEAGAPDITIFYKRT